MNLILIRKIEFIFGIVFRTYLGLGIFIPMNVINILFKILARWDYISVSK